MSTVGFIGGGNMAEALIKGVIAAGVYRPEDIFVSDIRPERLDCLAKEYGVEITGDNTAVAGKVDILVLAVKPQNMAEALEGIKEAVKKDALIISIAAGIKVENISAALGDMAIVRVMPNTPALIGEGASALFANDKAKALLERVKTIFSAVGKAVVINDEDLMDAVTAVSGSGPAYYFLFMEDMLKAAIKLGLPEDIAKELVLQTAKGASLLAVEADKKGESPEQLRKKVTSPGGTTEAALKVFSDAKFGALVSTAIAKARDRGRELAK